MFLDYINELPSAIRRNCRLNNNQLQKKLIDFYDSGNDYAVVRFDPDEYKSSMSIYSGLRKGVESLGIPVNVKMIQGEVYLERID